MYSDKTTKMGIWYHVAEPNSYLVITGAGIDKVTIKKKVYSTAYTSKFQC